MILVLSGMLFQVAVLSGAFALAGLVVLSAIARRPVVNNDEPTPVPNCEAGEDQSSPYEFVSVIEVEEKSEEVVAEKPLQFGRVAVAWVKNSDIFGVLGLCSFFVFLAFANLAASGNPKVPEVSSTGVLANFVIFGILLAITVALVYRRINPIVWLGLRWQNWLLALFSPLVVIGMWIILGCLAWVGYFAWMEQMCGESSTQEAVKMLRQNKDVVAVFLMAIAAAVMAPLVEEIIFRGYIYPAMKRWVGIWPAILFSSLVFAAGHGNAALTLPLLILGVVLVISYEYTGSIWMPIAIHACFNGATVGIQLLARFGNIPLPEPSP